MIKRFLSGAKIGAVIGLCLAGVMSIHDAFAIPPNRIFQLPVYFQRGSVVLATIYEDGGTDLALTGGQNADVGNLNVRQNLTVDGGSNLKALSVNSIVSRGSGAFDGGISAAQSIDLVSGSMIAEAGGFIAFGSKALYVPTHLMASGDNSSQCYIGAIGTAITFSPAFGSGTPHCTSCVDVTDGTKSCSGTATTTTGTLSGTGTDAVNICFIGIK